MNIDFDFIRNFLLSVEQKTTDPETPLTKDQLGFSQIPDGIYYRQMVHFERAELVETIYKKVDNIPQRFPGRLTEAGYLLLAKIRDNKVWDRIKSIQTGEMATFSLAVLIALAERVTQLNDN
jgi:hypothetical protein